MVFDPPKEKVDITFMIILSFIPIVFMYAFWRIQKFWVLSIIFIIVEGTIWIPFLIFGIIISWQISLILFVGTYIGLNIFLVKHFAQKYNQKLELSDNSFTEVPTTKSTKNTKLFFIIIAGICGIIILLTAFFIVPELTTNNLSNNIQNDLSDEEKKALDTLMNYKGSDKTGLNVMETISNKIDEKYPLENIYDNKATKIQFKVFNIDASEYQIDMNFESYKGKINYSWNIDIISLEVKANNQESKNIIDFVEYYD